MGDVLDLIDAALDLMARTVHRINPGRSAPRKPDVPSLIVVVRGPGLPAGPRVSRLTANVDHASTIAELAGVQPASHDAIEGSDRNRLIGPVNPTVEPADAFDTLATDTSIGVFSGLRTADGIEQA